MTEENKTVAAETTTVDPHKEEVEDEENSAVKVEDCNEQSNYIKPEGRRMVGERLCDICHKEAAKYSFKCCHWRFCGLSCYGVHVQSDTAKQASEEVLGEGVNNEEAKNDVSKQKNSCGGPVRLTARQIALAKSVKDLGGSLSEIRDVEQQMTEESGSLTDEQKKRLGKFFTNSQSAESNPEILKRLDSLGIRNAILSINKSINRIDELGSHMVDTDFAEFIFTLINTIENKQNEPQESI